MKTKMSVKEQQLQLLNRIITSNKKMFKAGSVIPAKQLAKLLSVDYPTKTTYEAQQRANFELVAIQTLVNKLLATSGLRMRSRNYYKEFYICDLSQTTKSIIRKSCKADSEVDQITKLEKGVVTRIARKNWGSYNKLTKKEVSSICTSKPVKSKRHNTMVQRVIQF